MIQEETARRLMAAQLFAATKAIFDAGVAGSPVEFKPHSFRATLEQDKNGYKLGWYPATYEVNPNSSLARTEYNLCSAEDILDGITSVAVQACEMEMQKFAAQKFSGRVSYSDEDAEYHGSLDDLRSFVSDFAAQYQARTKSGSGPSLNPGGA